MSSFRGSLVGAGLGAGAGGARFRWLIPPHTSPLVRSLHNKWEGRPQFSDTVWLTFCVLSLTAAAFFGLGRDIFCSSKDFLDSILSFLIMNPLVSSEENGGEFKRKDILFFSSMIGKQSAMIFTQALVSCISKWMCGIQKGWRAVPAQGFQSRELFISFLRKRESRREKQVVGPQDLLYEPSPSLLCLSLQETGANHPSVGTCQPER